LNCRIREERCIVNAQMPYDISVLYVEDEDFSREEIHQLLQTRVRQVFVAQNGAEGLELFRKNGPDMVITDILMPVLDGLKMVKEIRTDNRNIPVIVTTAYSETSYMISAIDAGVDQYVIKPIELEKLFAAIGKCAELIESRKAAKRYQEDRERLIGELQEALAKVKLLSGLLPICASCKKIREGDGYWTQVESYIHEHSEAEFSHGLCPECAKKLYPNYFKEETK
jgi:sigma-B regulation protein RsbU (phosphoserine phosphatase)